MEQIDNRKLSPLWKVLMKNAPTDPKKQPSINADKIGKCLTKRKINLDTGKLFHDRSPQITT